MTKFLSFPRLVAAGLTAAALAGAGLLASPTPPAIALTNCDVADLTVTAVEEELLTLINQYRVQNGRQPLTMSANLNRASSWMAIELVSQGGTLSHTDHHGRDAAARMNQCDANGSFSGENIAAGQTTPQEALDAWKLSSGHNQNMLDPNWKQIGVSLYVAPGSTYGYYWVTDFSAIPDGTVVGADSDGDGYPDSYEISIGENPNSYCAIMRADVDGDGVVSSLDLARLGSVFLQSVPPAPERYNQGNPPANNTIDTLDLAAIGASFTKNVSEC